MGVNAVFKKVIKRTANSFGLDIIRLAKSPRHTLLGIRQLPVSNIIDVGANSGQFARYIRKIFPKAHIYCFEPLSEPFRALQEWASNRADVTLFNLALSDAEGVAEMFYHLDHDTSSSLLPTTSIAESIYPLTQRQKTVLVPVSTLDGALHEASIPILQGILIKLDVQGYEEHVIRGGGHTFRQASACIVEINIDHLYSGQADFKQLVCSLDDFGLHYIGNLEQTYDEDGHVIFLDAIFARKR